MIHFHRPAASLDELVLDQTAQGRAVFVIDAGDDVKSSIAQFAEVLRLPEWFGHNLDALADALRDFRDGAAEPTTLIWDHIRVLRRHSSQGYETILAILDDVQDERDDVEVHVLQR